MTACRTGWNHPVVERAVQDNRRIPRTNRDDLATLSHPRAIQHEQSGANFGWSGQAEPCEINPNIWLRAMTTMP